jgi:hypothetical protein
MIQINLVARIAADKNVCFDLVFVASKLKEDGYTDFKFLFIGGIESPSIYQNIIRLAGLLNVTDHIDFTKKSIPMTELSEETKNGYFLNYSIGKFIGYSGIDSIGMGFKTIFVNGDKNHENEDMTTVNICRNIPELIAFIKLIHKDQLAMNKQIVADNLEMSKNFQLNEADKAFLLEIMR